jgi:hypothetical protein
MPTALMNPLLSPEGGNSSFLGNIGTFRQGITFQKYIITSTAMKTSNSTLFLFVK